MADAKIVVNDPDRVGKHGTAAPPSRTTGAWLEGRMMKRHSVASAYSEEDQKSTQGSLFKQAAGSAKRSASAYRRKSSFFSNSRKAMISASRRGSNGSFWGGSQLVRIKTQRHGIEHLVQHETPICVPEDTLLQTVSAEDLKAQVMVLSQLPTELAEVMRRYDLDENGALDREESIHAAADLARMRHQIEQGIVHLRAFPEYAQTMLQEHDMDGDGTLDVSEMIVAFQALERERQRSRMWMRVALAAALFILILLLAMSGLIYYILDAVKDSDVQNSVLVVRDTLLPVQTASADFKVENGKLLERNSHRTCGDQACPLQVAEAVERGAVSSGLADEVLDELKQLKISSGEAWVQLRVLAVQRLSVGESGSVVVIYTHVGEVELAGEALVVTARLQEVLGRSGIEAAEGQALQTGGSGPIHVTGTFNSLSSSP